MKNIFSSFNLYSTPKPIKIIFNLISNQQILAYIIVGFINTAFGYGLFCLFIFCSIRYQLAVMFATIIGVLFNFNTIGKLVFKNKNNFLIFRFIMVYSIQYFINISLIKLITELGCNLYAAGGVSTLFCAMISFCLHKYLVFR